VESSIARNSFAAVILYSPGKAAAKARHQPSFHK
jgi:hypothetical protein